MYDVIFKQAKRIDGTIIDIAIEHGKIVEIGEINVPAKKIIDLKARIISAPSGSILTLIALLTLRYE